MPRHTPRHTPHSSPRLIAFALAAVMASPAPAQCVLQPEQVVPFEAGAMRNTLTRGTVYATVGWDPDGPGPEPEWLVIAGDFTLVRGVAAPGIAAWDGSRWRSFASSVDGIVRALAVHQGRLIAAGNFSRVDGVLVGGLIELLPDSWQLFEGRVGPRGFSGSGDIHALRSNGEHLDVVGRSLSASDASGVPVVRWDGSVYRSISSDIGQGDLYDLTMHNGELYATGRTSPFYKNAVRYDGSMWHAVGNGFGASGYSLASHNGLLYAAVAAHSGEDATVRAWDGQAWSIVGTPLASVGLFFSVLSYGEDLLVTARTASSDAGVAGMEVWRLSQDTWLPLEAVTDSMDFGRTRSLATWKSQLIAAGQRHSAGARYLGGVARWTGNAWTSVDDMLSGSILSFIKEPESQNLIAVGPFTSIGGVYSPGIARVTPAGVEAIESPIVLADAEREYVRQVLWWGDRLVVGGSFLVEGSDSMGIVIQEPGGQWTAPDAPTPWFSVLQMVAIDDTLYIATLADEPGMFSTSLFSLRGGAWETIATFPSRIIDMCAFNGELIVSADFTNLGWDPSIRIGIYDGNAWRPLASDLGGQPASLTEHRGSLIASGDLTIGFGQEPAPIARWNGAAWTAIDSPEPTLPGVLESTDVGLITKIGEHAYLLRGGRWSKIPVGPLPWQNLSHALLPTDTSQRLALLTAMQVQGIPYRDVQTISSTSIPCEADVNCDQTTDILDLLDFLQAYSGCIEGATPCNQILADFNQDGTIDTLDALDFLQAYAQGCQ